jgi:hypothetical protein
LKTFNGLKTKFFFRDDAVFFLVRKFHRLPLGYYCFNQAGFEFIGGLQY